MFYKILIQKFGTKIVHFYWLALPDVDNFCPDFCHVLNSPLSN